MLTEASSEIGFELLDQQRYAFGAATPVANGVFDGFVELRPVAQFDLERVGDGALFGVVVIGGEGWLLDAFDLGTQSIDPRIGGDVVLVVSSGKAAKEQRIAIMYCTQ